MTQEEIKALAFHSPADERALIEIAFQLCRLNDNLEELDIHTLNQLIHVGHYKLRE